MYAIVSLRGHVRVPTLFVIDLDDAKIIERLEIPVTLPDSVPASKGGFSGLNVYDGQVLVATWDRVCLVDPRSAKLVDQIVHPQFSDLHSLSRSENYAFLVANTNLDGVYSIDMQTGAVHPVWHAWQESALGEVLTLDEQNLNALRKEEMPFHRYHINSAVRIGNLLVLSFLGKSFKPTKWQGVLKRLGHTAPRTRWRDGGYFIVDAETLRYRNALPCEGLHDTIPIDNRFIYSTQYFASRIVRLDIETEEMIEIPVQVPRTDECEYLTRGMLIRDRAFWIGHTVQRGWTNAHPVAKLRNYDPEGAWLGQEIEFPGYVGVYDIVELEA